MRQGRVDGQPSVESGFPAHANAFEALEPCNHALPTTVREVHDMCFPGDMVDIVVQQTHVTFATNRSWGAPGTGATPDKPHAEVD